MASTSPGNPRRRLPCGSVGAGGESAEVERDDGSDFRQDETPEEAARSIADALEFLARETAKLSVYGARDLIQRAAARMREFVADKKKLERMRVTKIERKRKELGYD